MRVVDYATLKGDGKTNQDRYLIGDYYAAVLDGASAYPPQPEGRDGGWYAEQLAGSIARLMSQDGKLEDVLASAIEAVATTHELRPDSSPSSTIALARWSETDVECLVLGDSSVVVSRGNGMVECLTDDRLATVAKTEREAYRRRLAAGYGYDEGHRALLSALQREQWRWRNTEGGYWIAEADPSAAHHALRRNYRKDQLESVALLSDGVTASVALMCCRVGSIPSMLRSCGCAELLAAIVDAELDDVEGTKHPRSKLSDDKTALLLEPST